MGEDKQNSKSTAKFTPEQFDDSLHLVSRQLHEITALGLSQIIIIQEADKRASAFVSVSHGTMSMADQPPKDRLEEVILFFYLQFRDYKQISQDV